MVLSMGQSAAGVDWAVWGGVGVTDKRQAEVEPAARLYRLEDVRGDNQRQVQPGPAPAHRTGIDLYALRRSSMMIRLPASSVSSANFRSNLIGPIFDHWRMISQIAAISCGHRYKIGKWKKGPATVPGLFVLKSFCWRRVVKIPPRPARCVAIEICAHRWSHLVNQLVREAALTYPWLYSAAQKQHFKLPEKSMRIRAAMAISLFSPYRPFCLAARRRRNLLPVPK